MSNIIFFIAPFTYPARDDQMIITGWIYLVYLLSNIPCQSLVIGMMLCDNGSLQCSYIVERE